MAEITESPKARLEYLRSQIEDECISMMEIAELQSLAEHIDPSDVQLLEWAGVPEFESPAPNTDAIFRTAQVYAQYADIDTESPDRMDIIIPLMLKDLYHLADEYGVEIETAPREEAIDPSLSEVADALKALYEEE